MSQIKAKPERCDYCSMHRQAVVGGTLPPIILKSVTDIKFMHLPDSVNSGYQSLSQARNSFITLAGNVSWLFTHCFPPPVVSCIEILKI